MTIPIDPKSVASCYLGLFAHSQEVGCGTGFLVAVDGIHILITNYHVVSGRDPDTRQQLATVKAIPDRLLMTLLRRSGPSLGWRPLIQHLYIDGEQTWVEHPRLKARFDVVAVPIDIPPDVQAVPYAREPGADIAVIVGSELSIVGFPNGMTGSGLTAIWKAGSVASEPALATDDENFFWIDANTRPGMSGSPVIARRFGGAVMNSGSYAVHTATVDRMIGVYAGRALDAPDMTLGRVWRWEGVQEVVDSAISMIRRGSVRAHPCLLGHYRHIGDPMIKLDVSTSVSFKVKNPQTGQEEPRVVNLSDIIRDFVLVDQRFGTSLARVKIAATIAAACEHAQTNGGQLELDDQQYALVRETIENPGQPYNPVVARHILPLLQQVMDAGQS